MDISTTRSLEKDLLKNFKFTPTQDQQRALKLLADYCLSLKGNQVFLLKGYAGTGKTTLIKTLVKTLPAYKRKTVLLAPTGRAAKVMSGYAGKAAFTIHKHIYNPKRDRKGGMVFTLKQNKSSNTIYIVDEASMITDAGSGGMFSTGLLNDLLEFVQAGVNCKVVFVGDSAQLPPVNSELSPALDPSYLGIHYRKEGVDIEMKEVMRQAKESGILMNATTLRDYLENSVLETPVFQQADDVIRLLEGYEIEDALNQSFKEAGREGTVVIVRSNKRANLYNRQIRSRILWQEDMISTGDYLMVVKNNYFWLPEKSKVGFIANGDIIELLQIYEHKELYGYRFVRAQIRLVDYPDEKPLDVVLMLDVLDMQTPSLDWEKAQQFYQTVLEDYADISSRYKRHQKVRENPYFNALQVKFAYAITCHKAQGGQWRNVFVEQPYLPNGEIDQNYLRWLYTAFTRAREKVCLIGFRDENFA